MTEQHSSPNVSPTRRELATITCLLVLAVLFCFRELAQNPSHLLVGSHRGGENDLTSQFFHFLELPAASIAHGEMPGWNPYRSLGGPTWGNPQSLLFYPPNWLCWWLGASAVSWLLVAHHLWAGLGAYLWARRLGVQPLSGLIAGVIAAAAPYAIAHTAEGHYPQTCVMSWIPWTLWAFERFLSSHGRQWLAVSVCLAMCFLGGHVQESFYVVLLTSGTLAVLNLGRTATQNILGRGQAPQNSKLADFDVDDKGRPVPPILNSAVPDPSLEIEASGSDRRNALRMAACWGVAGAVTVGMVLIELLPTLANSQLSMRANGLPMSMSGAGLTSKHIPLLWNSRPLEVTSLFGAFGPWEVCFHFGLIPLALAGLALLTGRSRPATWRVIWMLAITVVFAFGNQTPLFRWCYTCLPGVASFRSPSRALYLSSTLVAVLAAIGWDSLWTRLPNQRVTRPRFFQMTSLLMLSAITWELGTFSQRALATLPITALRHNSTVSAFFRERPSTDRVLAGLGLYDDREAQRDGVQKLLGYDPFMFQRYATFFDALTPEGSKLDAAGFQPPRFRDLHKPLADLAGVRYAVMSAKQPDSAGWKRVISGTVPREITSPGAPNNDVNFAIFENQTVMPRAFVMGQVTESLDATSDSSLAKQLTQIDPRQTVLLSRDHWPRDTERTPFAEATIEAYSANEVRVRANSTGHGYLVLTDLFHPGWSATVDGQPTTILPADIAFRAVPLTPGEHSIVFRFVVPGWKVGAIVSTLSWLTAICLAVFRSGFSAETERDRGQM